MLYEVYKQLQGKAGPRQVKQPALGLTHNQGGEPGAATVSVLIAGTTRLDVLAGRAVITREGGRAIERDAQVRQA